MSLWIKICGNTSLGDALLAVESGADAVGFVFAASPRQVTAKQVESIVPRLPSSIEKIGIFVNNPEKEIEAVVRASGLTGVQLHSDARRDTVARLRNSFGSDLRILRVVHFAAGFAKQVAELEDDGNIDAVLVDSRTATAVGGTGVAYDWSSAAAELSSGVRAGVHVVVAGGLNPGNVKEAIAKLRPWGVDVVSGVEAAPGRKDPEKVRAFIERARAAAAANDKIEG